MQLLQYAVVVAGILTNTAVNAMPMAGLEISELVYLLNGFKGEKLTNCDISKAIMPQSSGPNYLTPPDKGLVLSRVVLGRGTQNYTCVDATDASVPVAQGAVANLYDVSCLAAKRPELLHLLPDVIVNIEKATIEAAVSIVSRMTRDKFLIGHHYFAPNNTIPVFDFRMEKSQSLIFRGKKDQGVPATTAASKGIPTEQNGAVDWLRIVAIQSLSVGFKLVYRVQTAGGKSPSTCKGMSKSFEIQYATEYWIYS